MNGKAWAEVVLARLQLSPNALRAWTWVLLLAPLAWAAGLYLRYEITTHTWPEAALDRTSALHKARLEAHQRGIDVAGWRESIELRANPVLDGPVHDLPPEMRRWVYENAPPRGLVTNFANQKTGEKVSFDLNLRGQVTGFREELRGGECGAPPSADKDESQNLARQAFARRFARWPQLNREAPSRSVVTSRGETARVLYSWRVQVPELNDIPMRYEVEYRCGRMAGEQMRPELEGRRPRAGVQIEKNREQSIYGILSAFYFCFAIPWIAVRYIKRSLQREAPQGRILLAGAVFAVFVALSMFDRAPGFTFAGEHVPLPVQLFFGGLALAVAAMLFGMAYAAAEGEVRELHPGTMTSLDALLTGQLYTRNTGLALLLGMALGGWLLLGTQAASLLRGHGPVDLAEVEFAFARVPWLTALLKAPFSAILSGVFGFLVPLAMFKRLTIRLMRRWPRQAPRVHLALVFVATAAGFALAAPSSLAFLGQTLWGATNAAALFAAFFWASDLLAGLAALATLRIGLAAGTLMAAEPWSLDLAVLLCAGVAVAAAACFAASRGILLRDEDVRPQYAANLAERLRLEQEIDSTRVAQRCLLPAVFPQIEGLDAAAVCLPARDVAGDFYDAFPLGGARLGVLLAEGGGQRLARALSIALVKGYLMQKVTATRTPGEALAALHATTGHLVEGSTNNLCLAVIDADGLSLRYARTGEWPALLVRRTADAPALPCAEASHDAGGIVIYEGGAALEPGSLILMYSDGVGRHSGMVRMLRQKRFERRSEPLPAAGIVNAVLGKLSRRASKRLPDDLTLVAVRLDASRAGAREVVA